MYVFGELGQISVFWHGPMAQQNWYRLSHEWIWMYGEGYFMAITLNHRFTMYMVFHIESSIIFRLINNFQCSLKYVLLSINIKQLSTYLWTNMSQLTEYVITKPKMLRYCHVPAGWGLQQTTLAPGSDKTRGQGSFSLFTGGLNLTPTGEPPTCGVTYFKYLDTR